MFDIDPDPVMKRLEVTSIKSDTDTPKVQKGSGTKSVKVRKEFPETWLWTEEVVK